MYSTKTHSEKRSKIYLFLVLSRSVGLLSACLTEMNSLFCAICESARASSWGVQFYFAYSAGAPNKIRARREVPVIVNSVHKLCNSTFTSEHKSWVQNKSQNQTRTDWYFPPALEKYFIQRIRRGKKCHAL